MRVAAGSWSSCVVGACAVISLFAPGAALAARERIQYTSVAIEPGISEKIDPGRTLAADSAALADLILSLAPHLEVRWRPPEAGGREVFRMSAPASGPEAGRTVDALSATRRMMAALPRSWRRGALKRLERLGLGHIDEESGGALLDSLAARLAGDPVRAAELLEKPSPHPRPAILKYLAGAARLDAGDLDGAVLDFKRLDGGEYLPDPLPAIVRAAVAAAEGDARSALSILEGVTDDAPSLVEARLLRVSLRLGDCSSYDIEGIRRDVAAAFDSSPCCASCALTLAETESFVGNATEAIPRLLVAGCAAGALDSARDRAIALLEAARGNGKEAMGAAARAEAKDVSALRRGLAPAFILTGDHAHLEEAYDPEGDAHLSIPVSVQQHLYAGLNDLWTGRPSAAAIQFERGLERERTLSGSKGGPSPWTQVFMTLRIRSYLTAGRVQEAKQAAAEASAIMRDRSFGLLEFTIAGVSIAGGDVGPAVSRMSAPGRPQAKLWNYLTHADVLLAAGRAKDAYDISTLALAGVGSQVTVCPGISTEPYLLEPQARSLLALGRPQDASRMLDRLLALGSRGLFAPDVVVPAWLLAGQAREASGDTAGARAAYRALLDRWGTGEDLPAVRQARERLSALH
jgi:hypothetical protein